MRHSWYGNGEIDIHRVFVRKVLFLKILLMFLLISTSSINQYIFLKIICDKKVNNEQAR